MLVAKNYYATRGVTDFLDEDNISFFVSKFLRKDFGDLCEEDLELQKEMIKNKDFSFIMGSYVAAGTKIWIILEYENLTVLLPEER